MKVFQFNLQDGFGNKKTLNCFLKDGSIMYEMHSSWGSSGMPISVENIHLKYALRLPIETLEEETKEEFTRRVWMLLEDSTDKPVHSVNVNVKFV